LQDIESVSTSSIVLRRVNTLLPAIVVALVVAACGKDKPATSDTTAAGAKTISSSTTDTAAHDTSSASDSIPLGPLKGVDGFTLGGDCPDAGPGAEAEILAQAAATIPLKVGLTLSHTWRSFDGDYDHECLEQVTAIDVRSVLTTGSCPIGKSRQKGTWVRRICRVDLRDSYMYETSEFKTFPETMRGALKFSMSTASFAALKKTGETRHRYIDLGSHPFKVDGDIDGTLKSEGKSTFNIIINDQKVEVPTIEATYRDDQKHHLIRVKVLDDDRVPFMLDYYEPGQTFFITYTKVSFPGEIADELAKKKRVDVYGIYFDFASDSIRPESEPILREIGAALASNKDWTLTINGHTDSVGTVASNRDLSERRSAAVKKALVERYKVDPSRLTTNGFGSSQPKEPNDTDIGRARNRRVELIRQ
jgi:outer membrane protein OmpA-like peptidoglycan-associated protein